MAGGSRHASRSSQPRSDQPRSDQQGPRQAVAGGSVDEGRIADVIRPVVAAAGMDLEAIRVSAAGRRRLLRVVVDSDQGVSLDDAATVSRQLSAALDTMAVMGDFSYTLEVSSPGIDRPLVRIVDYARFAGHEARLETTTMIDGRRRRSRAG